MTQPVPSTHDETGTRSTSARVRRVGLTAAVVVLAIEASVRLVADQLPIPQLWSAPEMPVKEAQMDELARDGGASIVFLGSSTMDAAADASAFEIPGASRPAYNASTGAGSMRTIDIWGRMVAIPRLRPDVVVIGVVSRELNPNDAQQALNEANFMDSTATRRLLGDETLLQRVERRVASVSAIVEYRSVLRQPRRVWDTLFTGEFRSGEFGEVVASDGQYEGFLDQRLADTDITADLVRRTLLRDFEIGADQVHTLRRLLAELAGQNLRVLVVNMPVADVYVAAHPDGEAGYRRAVEVVRLEAERTGARHVDIGPWPDELMADMGHVNAAGARRFTAELTPILADELAAATQTTTP